jgi:hypothetical protein
VIEGLQQCPDKKDLIALLMLRAKKTGRHWAYQWKNLARKWPSDVNGADRPLFASMGISDYRSVVSAHYRMVYRQIDVDTAVYAVPGQFSVCRRYCFSGCSGGECGQNDRPQLRADHSPSIACELNPTTR